MCAEKWTFITNYGAVLAFVAKNPRARGIDIAMGLGMTERSVRRITANLEAAGYIRRVREGILVRYEVDATMPLRRPEAQSIPVGELVNILGPALEMGK